MNIDFHKNFIKIKSRQETNYIVVHCSATQNKPEIDWKTIDRMHRENGWLMCGYHYVIKTDGTIQNGRDRDAIGAHVSGHNDDSIGICLVGGVDSNNNSVDNFTDEQKESLAQLLLELKNEYPDAVIQGHRDFKGVAKDCPCFDVKKWMEKHCKIVPYSEGQLTDKLEQFSLSALTFKALNPNFNETARFVRVC